MPHQQHRLIRRPPTVSAFFRKSSWPLDDDDHHKEVKSASARRLVSLLLLMLILMLMLYDAIFPLSILAPADSENYRKFKSMKTHIQVKQSRLQARKEKPNISSSSSSSSSSQIPCSKLINGEKDETSSPWTVAADGLLCCDRSNHRTDVCYLRGDIRTSPASSSIFLYNARHGSSAPEKIRPYTRKFEPEIMQSVQELSLVPVAAAAANASTPRKPRCDVTHRGVPAVVFSAGGYTGNMYHEFSDGLIPLYVTSRHFTAAAEAEGEVVLVVADYRRWWASKYRLVFKRMSKYRIVDLAADHRVHCFSEMIVGLRFHGELVIDPQQMPNGEGIQNFQALIRQALDGPPLPPRKSRQRRQQPQLPPQLPVPLPLLPPSSEEGEPAAKPKMVIFVRNRTRVLLNLQEIVEACEETGFRVQVLDAKQHTPLAAIHRSVASSQAMLAVHGAAATHFLFMRPPAALLQIVPIGLDWAADAFYGAPARRLGLRYVEYKVSAEESSLSADYDRRSPVLADPSVVSSKGWWEMKKVYMDRQNVRVNVSRFSRVLESVFLLHASASALPVCVCFNLNSAVYSDIQIKHSHLQHRNINKHQKQI